MQKFFFPLFSFILLCSLSLPHIMYLIYSLPRIMYRVYSLPRILCYVVILLIFCPLCFYVPVYKLFFGYCTRSSCFLSSHPVSFSAALNFFYPTHQFCALPSGLASFPFLFSLFFFHPSLFHRALASPHCNVISWDKRFSDFGGICDRRFCSYESSHFT